MTRGAVAAGHPETVAAARNVLDSGGNAFDAALAALATACVVEPVLASLGGGGFLLARRAGANEQFVIYDFFAQTPRQRKPSGDTEFYPILADFGTATQEFHIGTGAVATPGVVPGIFAVHGDLCSMPVKEIFQHAIGCACDGVPVNAFQAYLFGVVEAIFSRESASLACFGSPLGGLAKTGEIITNPELGDTLDALSHEGEVLFREGEMAKAISELCMTHGAHLGADDLRIYKVERRQPLLGTYRGATIITNPGPSTGGVLIGFALSLLERAGLHEKHYGSLAYYNTLARTMAATNRARLEIGDTHSMLDEAFLAHYVDLVLGRPAAHRGTTHISIIDAEGNAAALTLSNGEGCAHMVPGGGFMLNNMLGEEDINPIGFNKWSENVRLCSMMAPTIIEHCDKTLSVLGSGGSNRIRTALLQVILNLIDRDMDLQEAVAEPRIHFENDILNVESLADTTVIDSLRVEYEDFLPWGDQNMFFGGVHAVSRNSNARFQAIGDLRRSGAFWY